MPHKPPVKLSIDDLGLPHWINAGRAAQNGYGWKDFDLFCELSLPDTVIGKIFNKSDKTVKDWKRRRLTMNKQ